MNTLIFFRLLLSNCLNWKIYCDDHSSLSSTTAVQNELFHYFTSIQCKVFKNIMRQLHASLHFTEDPHRLKFLQTGVGCVRCWITDRKWVLSSINLTKIPIFPPPPIIACVTGSVNTSGAHNIIFRKISDWKTIWDLEFTEHLLWNFCLACLLLLGFLNI